MKTYPFAIAIVGLLATQARPQTAPPSATRNHGDLSIVAQLSEDLKAKKLKIGDKVSAKVIQDLVADGRILVRRDSKLIGRVVEVSALSKDDPRSRLALVFDRAEAKGGEASVIHGVIQAIAPPLPDPFLEAIMGSSSSAYAGGQNGHPVNTPTGQSNTPTPIITSGRTRSGAGALEQRQRALETAGVQGPDAGLPEGALTFASHGVFSLPGLFLAGGSGTPAIVAVGQNVELKNGTQIVLKLAGGLLAPAN